MLGKLLLTVLVGGCWCLLTIANLVSAGRAEAQMVLKRGLPAAAARRKTTFALLAWEAVVSVLAGAGAVWIWR
ncbi:MAG TPA: hypothetical protein VIW28_09185 [Gemmatimonadales bacterium]|jgi:hypothetical protein